MNEKRLLLAAELGVFTSRENAEALRIGHHCAANYLLEMRRSGLVRHIYMGNSDGRQRHYQVTPKTLEFVRGLLAAAAEASHRAVARETRLRQILTCASVAIADSKMSPRLGSGKERE